MARCTWPEEPNDGKTVAVLFKVEGDGSRVRARLRPPDWCNSRRKAATDWSTPSVTTTGYWKAASREKTKSRGSYAWRIGLPPTWIRPSKP
eukprot:15465760-Alexandrium_andersonii.AAC.1